jgi:hypothetical protein
MGAMSRLRFRFSQTSMTHSGAVLQRGLAALLDVYVEKGSGSSLLCRGGSGNHLRKKHLYVISLISETAENEGGTDHDSRLCDMSDAQ